MDESDYRVGNRAAWVSMLNTCLHRLGADNPSLHHARWTSEREEAIAILRQVCAAHGDSAWDESLHLADIIEKHLWRHLPERAPGEKP